MRSLLYAGSEELSSRSHLVGWMLPGVPPAHALTLLSPFLPLPPTPPPPPPPRFTPQGNVREVLWFFDPGLSDPFAVDGRCLVRYSDERVKQSVLPPADARLGYAMGAHGVKVRVGGGVGGGAVSQPGSRGNLHAPAFFCACTILLRWWVAMS